MRISDWSSDVCSSDLGLIGIAVLQTSIDHDLVHNQTVLGAAIQTGSPALAERIAATTDLLVSRGVEASAAAKTATALVGRPGVRRVGKACFSTCRSRWLQYHLKKRKTTERTTRSE